MAANVDIRLLGPPEVFQNGQPVKFAARKALALFAYLAVEFGAHPREKLQAIFWPESGTRRSQSALRTTLTRLRGAIEGLDDPLCMDRDQISLCVPCESDFGLVAHAAARERLAPIPALDIDHLQDAVCMVRGPFMEAFSLPDTPVFDDWVLIQRNLWRGRLNLIHDRLSRHQLESHLIEPALETVNRWLTHDHLNETAYRRLMRLHFLNGDRSAALQAYEICRGVLGEELGVEPSGETEELYEFVRSARNAASVPAALGQATGSRFSIPFVGRSLEFQTLVETFHQAVMGMPRFVVVTGESGMGKTRFLTEFLNWASTDPRQPDILRGRSYETGGALPYQALVDALRERLERENAPDDLLDDIWLGELSQILPELHERYPDLPRASSDDPMSKLRLFEAVARLGVSLAARRPVIVALDDVQWADKGTLELLHYLARHWQRNHVGVLIVLLSREEMLSYGWDLREWMSVLTRDVPVRRLSLPPINESDVRKVVISLAGAIAEGADDLSRWLAAETHCQPYFLVETLAALNDYGALVWERSQAGSQRLNAMATLANLRSTDSLGPAPTIQDVILSRLEWLSRPAMAVLAAVAVIGRKCSFRLLCQLTGHAEDDALDALDELLSVNMILQIRDEARPYAISHDYIRHVVYEQMTEARREVLHRRALTRLEESGAVSAELAYHAYAARDWAAVFMHSLTAGDEALSLYDASTAAKHYEAARTLLRELKAVAEDAGCEHLYLQLGRVYEIIFRQRDALAVYRDMLEQAVERGSRQMELSALVACCGVLSQPFDAHDVEQTRILARKALHLARALGNPRAQAELERDLALTHIHGDGQIEPALAHCETSAALARRERLPEQLALALMNLTSIHMSRGQVERAEMVQTEAIELFRELDDRPKLQDVLHGLGMIHMGSGRLDSALIHLEEAYRANEALGSATETYALALTRNVIHIVRGEYERAMGNLLSSIELPEADIVQMLRVEIHQQLAWCYCDLGAYEQGVEHARRAIDYHDHVTPSARVPAFSMLAMLYVAEGDLVRAASAVEMGVGNFDPEKMAFPWWWESLSILQAAAELAMARDDIREAERCTEQLLRKYDQLKFRHLLPAALALRGRVALMRGDDATAREALMDALGISDEMGAHREVWRICDLLAAVETGRENLTTATKWRERARVEVGLLADHTGSSVLRQTFLARPDVQKILDA